MAQFELILPKMGESVAEATVTNWLKNVGDVIDAEESVVEVATDKVDSEVPSPVSGTLVKILVDVNGVAEVGSPIAIIEVEGEGSGTTASAAPEVAPEPAVAVAEIEAQVAAAAATVSAPVPSGPIAKNSNGRFYSPLVRSMAKEEGIGQAELDQISGSGKEGRVTKKDIVAYLEAGRKATAPVAASQTPAASAAPAAPVSAAPAVAPKPSAPAMKIGEGDEIIEMDRMRKLIADHMVNSVHTSPHVTSFVEADMTKVVLWRNRMKNEFQKKHGEKITFTPIIMEAIVKAIQDFPMINISIEGNNIIKHGRINVGMAAALPSGNLIVPVVKNADQLSLLGLTKAVNDLANRARNNQLKPDEISGGTYTLTNVGTFGNVMGTPIINQPQVAIMAAGAIVKKPAVVETPEGDVIAVRHKMFLSHSYDHRAVDGALGGMFVKRVAEYLESWDLNREI
ncbi:2-oxo acid dehydrogenase subunit E2 [Schleiferiaceae bacterium]|jgi:2-oxoglutarate dehydrogenase E2 component (dihydrolipoamide succinyltransferase)|nr:2-oxo acid dehydrogenase subunit E2 [Schleiferiaceae bacterium]MDB2539994.1 2-oxo acid dehydrogenase subunit E2 [Schleiferiaceae bacterium]MDB2581727.1 2-oxo acid dehydrogenase subunit E2 [Schleiferiaceae bacterium]